MAYNIKTERSGIVKTQILGLLIDKCQKTNLKEYDYNILFKLDEKVLEYLATETHLINFNYLLKMALDFYQYHCKISSEEVIAVLEKCQKLFNTSIRDLVIYLMGLERLLMHSELITPTLDLISNNINEKKAKAIIKAVDNSYIYELGMSLEVAQYISSLNEDLIPHFESIYSHKLSSEDLKTYMEIYRNCSNKAVAYYVYQAFFDITAIEHKSNISLARIISESKSYLASDIFTIGSSEDLYAANLAEDSLKVMQNAKSYNAYEVRLLLIDKQLIEKGQSLIKARILCLSKNEVETSLIFNLLKSNCFTENVSSILAMLILNYKVAENGVLLKEMYGERVKTSRLVADITDFLKTLEVNPIVFNYALESFNKILFFLFGLEINVQELTSTSKDSSKTITYDEALMLEYQSIAYNNIKVATFGERVRKRMKKSQEIPKE